MLNQVFDESGLVQRIAALALPKNLTILFLATIESIHQEPAANLRLANLSALNSAFFIESETKLVSGGNWINAALEVWQAGDQIICLADQTILDQEMNQIPLSTAISIALDVPVMVLNDLSTEKQPRHSTRLSEFKWWSVVFIIIIVLFGTMFYINQITRGWVEAIYMLTAFSIAIIMIWLWIKQR